VHRLFVEKRNNAKVLKNSFNFSGHQNTSSRIEPPLSGVDFVSQKSGDEWQSWTKREDEKERLFCPARQVLPHATKSSQTHTQTTYVGLSRA
jgi:hypothetical protein